MKKIGLTIFIATCMVCHLKAQDLIVKKDSSQIEARVTEVSSSEIRYKKFSNPAGPTYVIPVSEVSFIRYPDGEKDVFSTEADANDGVVAPSARYAVGDVFYDETGVPLGMVYKVEDKGRHGMIMSFDEVCLAWSTLKKPIIGASDESDGMKNMESVGRYIAEHGYTWDDFPAFEWCRDKGEGWYLPSIDELLEVGNSFNGGKRLEIDHAARKIFNGVLKANGGNVLNRRMYYHSSMEDDDRFVVCGQMSIEPPYVFRRIPKGVGYLVRAVRKF